MEVLDIKKSVLSVQFYQIINHVIYSIIAAINMQYLHIYTNKLVISKLVK